MTLQEIKEQISNQLQQNSAQVNEARCSEISNEIIFKLIKIGFNLEELFVLIEKDLSKP
jgi:hypothetical protein